MKEQRIDLWDNLKFFLIFLVVLGHMVDQFPDSNLFQSIYVFVYAFHMPLFFFISGLFHKNKAIVEKVITFIALGYVYKFFLFGVRSFMKEDVELHFLSESGTPWFMFALAAFILLSYLLQGMNQGFILVISILMACFVGYDQSIGSKFILSRIIYFYPFYVMGQVANQKRLMEITRQKKFRFLGAIVLVMWFLVCIWQRESLYVMRDLFMGMKLDDEQLTQSLCLIRLGFYGITIATGFACICLIPHCRIPWITVMGGRTIQIYFWHRPILYVLADLGFIEQIRGLEWGRIVYMLLSIPFTLLLATKVFSFPTSQILWFGKELPLRTEEQYETMTGNGLLQKVKLNLSLISRTKDRKKKDTIR